MTQKGFGVIYILIGILILVIVAGGAYYLGKSQTPKSVSQNPMVISTPQSSPSSSQTDQLELIKIACAKTVKQSLNITINPENIILKSYEKSNKYVGKFSNGSYGEKGTAGGGFYLAAYTNGEWICPVVGNGTVACSDVDPYNFPVDLISRCIDSNNNDIDRSTHLPL